MECSNKKRSEWGENNKEHRIQYYEANKEKYRQYREDNKERKAEYDKQYRKINADKLKQYYENNKDQIAKYQKKYRQSPQGRVNAFNAQCKRRQREEINGGKITKEQWLECMKYFGFRDAYSGEILAKDTRSLDHIQPVSREGTNNIWNLVPTTRINNCSKNNKDMLEWYKEQLFYSEERLNKIYEWIKYAKNKYAEEEQLKWI